MPAYEPKNIRNVCLIGHGGDGKTSLAEAMLYLAKATDRLGKQQTETPFAITMRRRKSARYPFQRRWLRWNGTGAR